MPFFSYYKDDTIMFRHLTDESPNNDPFYMHIHDQFEILYFISGKASCTIETNTMPLLPNTMLIMRPMETHRITILANEPYERFTINFSESLLTEIDPTSELLKPFYDRDLGEKNMYYETEFELSPKKLFMQMEHASQHFDQKEGILIYFYALLGQIRSVFEDRKHTTPTYKKTMSSEVANYINNHLYDDISVKSLAEQFFISVSQLNRQFKNSTGFSVWEYVLGKRLVSVRNLIRTGTPITTAYQQCGFNDYSSFYRLYKKKFNISPQNDIIKS